MSTSRLTSRCLPTATSSPSPTCPNDCPSGHHHAETNTHEAARADLAAMQLDEVLGDGKPHAGAFLAAGGLRAQPCELLEQQRHLLLRDARPAVRDLKQLAAHDLPRADPDDAAWRAELDRVAHKVGDDLRQPVRVAERRGQVRVEADAQVDVLLAAILLVLLQYALHEVVEPHWLKRKLDAAAADGLHIEEVVDDGAHHVERVLHGAHDAVELRDLAVGALVMPVEQVHCKRDIVYGRAKIVRGDLQEAVFDVAEATQFEDVALALVLQPLEMKL